jgi:uncharacterized protein (TIGR03437 family)
MRLLPAFLFRVLIFCLAFLAVLPCVHPLYGQTQLPSHAVFLQPFEENRGQAPGRYSHLLRAPGYTVGFSPDSLVVALAASQPSAPAPVLGFSWLNASPTQPQGQSPAASSIYDLTLPASRQGAAIPAWTRLRYPDAYPGIDLVYYQSGGHLEFDLEIAPHADRTAPLLRIDGAESLDLDPAGNLVITLQGHRVLLRAPRSFQTAGSQRLTVPSRYRLLEGHRVAIDIGEHNPALPLTIDPIVDFATYFGGSGPDRPTATGTDAAGNIYLLGYLYSPRLPGDGAGQPPISGSIPRLFVSRISPDLTTVQRTTYLDTPANYNDLFANMAVAPDGQVYVIYFARGTVSSLQSTVGPYLFPSTATSSAIIRTAILALTPDGSALRFRTLVGCQSPFLANALHAAADGLTFAAAAECLDFPVSSGAYSNNPPRQPGVAQVVMARISPDGQQLPFSTRFGGSASQGVGRVWRDAGGRTWLFGSTSSPDFPTTPGAYQTTRSPAADAFLLRLNAQGSALEASTLLPGRPARFRVTPDSFVHLFVYDTPAGFQVSPQAFQTTRGQNGLALLRMDADLKSILWSTFYLNSAGIYDLAVNEAGETLILSDVPGDTAISQDALLRRYHPDRQRHHLGRISAGGSVLRNATYFFGTTQGNASSILSFTGGTSLVVTGAHQAPFSPPATTATNLTVGQSGQPSGIHFSRIQWNDPTACNIRLSPATQNVSADGGDARIRVEAPPGCPWVLSHPFALSFPYPDVQFPSTAGIGPGEAVIRYPRWNNSGSDLSINYWVDDQEVTVVQTRASCSRRSITPSTVDIDVLGGLLSLTFDIPAGCEWNWTPPAPWAILSSIGSSPLPQDHTGSVPVRLEVLPNSFEARETSFSIAGITVPVRQASGACTATVSPLEIDLPASGGNASINIAPSAASCTWQALPAGDVSIVGSATGTGTGSVQLSLPANPANVPLLASVFVAGKLVQVRQAAGQCQASVTPPSLQAGPAFSSLEINIQATGSACAWRTVASQPWMQLYPQSAPQGSGQLRVNLRENNTGLTRTGTIQLLGHTVNVTQLGEPSGQVHFAVAQQEPFVLNGVTYVGEQFISLPMGSSFTVTAQPRRQPAPGVLVLNTGWNQGTQLTQTFTVNSAFMTVQLNGTTFVRLQLTQSGNTPGDGSTAIAELPANTWRDEPDGRYVRHGVTAYVRAVPGNQSRFVRWEGAPSSSAQSREFHLWLLQPYSLTAVFEPLGPAPPLQINPARLALRYGSAQDILSAVGNLTAGSPTTIGTGGISCAGLSVLPFSAAVMAAATPTTVQVNLQVHVAALLDPGEYVCEAMFTGAGNPAVSIAVPVDISIQQKQVPANAVRVGAVVEGAAFRRLFPAPGSIASIFGERLASAVFEAQSIPLPTVLGGTRVELVHQDTGVTAAAPLFFVAPQQINFLVPATFPTGRMELRVHRDGLLSGAFPSFVQSHQPSLFSANSDGKGAPAGEFLRVNSQNGARVSGALAVCSGGAGTCSPRRLEFGTDQETLFLVLYGTGFSAQSGLATVSLDGEPVPVEYTGPQGSFVGLDQINLRVPRSFAGRGIVTLEVRFAGLPANSLQVRF